MKSIVYLRRSSKSYEGEVSLLVQREACDRYASSAHLTIDGQIVDDGVSGTKRSRFARLSLMLAATGYKNIIVYSIDRLARDVSGLLDELEKYEKLGVTVHCATQNKPISIAKAHDFLAVGVEALVAQHYSKLIAEKTKDAHARLRVECRRQSRYPPAGYSFAGGKVLADLAVQDKIEQAKALRAEGLTLRAIDTIFRGKGLKFSISTWGKILV